MISPVDNNTLALVPFSKQCDIKKNDLYSIIPQDPSQLSKRDLVELVCFCRDVAFPRLEEAEEAQMEDQKETKRLYEKVKRQKTKINDLNAKLAELAEDRKSLSEELQKVKKLYKCVSTQFKKVQEENTDLAKKYSKKEEAFKNLAKNYFNVMENFSNLKASYVEVKRNNNIALKKIAKLEAESNEAQKQAKLEIANFKQQLKEAKRQLFDHLFETGIEEHIIEWDEKLSHITAEDKEFVKKFTEIVALAVGPFTLGAAPIMHNIRQYRKDKIEESYLASKIERLRVVYLQYMEMRPDEDNMDKIWEDLKYFCFQENF